MWMCKCGDGSCGRCKSIASVGAVIGRVLLALIFVYAGYGKLMTFEQTVGFIESLGFPVATIITALVILLELGGGIAIALGYKTRLVAPLLAIFCVWSGFLIHSQEPVILMKNLAIAGGFLVLASRGAGAYSLDTRCGDACGVCHQKDCICGKQNPTA